MKRVAAICLCILLFFSACARAPQPAEEITDVPEVASGGRLEPSEIIRKPPRIPSAYVRIQKDLGTLQGSDYEGLGFTVVQELETDACTVILIHVGGLPHHVYRLYLFYKPGFLPGENGMIKLPLPFNMIGSECIPDDIRLSEDGKKLYYSFYFDGLCEYRLNDGFLSDAGTYTYTADLLTAEVTVDFQPDEASGAA